MINGIIVAIAMQASLQKTFNITSQTAHNIIVVSNTFNLDPILIASLAKSESDFNMLAIADNGRYFGAMQVPCANCTEYLNYVIGCIILQEKIKLAQGNIHKAIALYKGGNNQMAYRQSKIFWKIYKEKKMEYYKVFRKEVIDIIRDCLSEEEYRGFLKGNIIKYSLRAGFKTPDPVQDLDKRNDYLNRLMRVLSIR